jgi:hypothetical protein
MAKSLLRLTSVVLVWSVFCTFTLADAPSAILYANGNVSVNGKQVSRSTSVFDGDSIRTAADGGGMVALNGSSVTVQAGSQIVFSRAAIQIHSGAAAVKTTQRMTASVGGYEVTPLDQDSQFQIAQVGTKIHVSALRGKLGVSGPNALTVDAGKTAILNCKTCSTIAEPQTGGTGTDSGSKVNTGLIIGMVAAGIGIGLGLALNQPQRDASPAGP